MSGVEFGPAWFIAWIPFSLYYIATLPQILTNYRNQSTAGLSYRMVFFDYTGAISTTIYTFLLCLPLACRVMEPLCVINIGFLVAQGFYYAKDRGIRRNILLSYIALHIFCLGALLVGKWHAAAVGNMMGWLSCVVQFFTQLPQILKNHQRKSVQGLSFLYFSLLGIAGFFEMFIAYLLGLPKQSFFNGLRGLGYYLILCYQFYSYRFIPKKALGVVSRSGVQSKKIKTENMLIRN